LVQLHALGEVPERRRPLLASASIIAESDRVSHRAGRGLARNGNPRIGGG